MAKGMRVKLNYEIGRDPDTGVEVTRLTPPEVTCHRNYFYQKCFFNDGSHLLFAGAFDGHWNYYLLDLQNAAYTSRFLKASGTSLKPLEMTAAMMRPTMNQLTPTP